jgi:hypothetical protein
MTEFERRQTSVIDKRIREDVSAPKVGVVNQVYEHAAPDDDSNFEVDVVFDGGVSEEKQVPVHTAGSSNITPPKNGDKILVIYREGNTSNPIAFGTGFSISERPPTGRAGMHRNEFESASSPLGSGNLYITGYTSYDGNVASEDKRELSPEESVVQLAKHENGKNVDPFDSDTANAKVEMYDSPKEDKAWISVEINKEDGSDSDTTWGMKFNVKTGEWKLVGPSGFGITSDGSGNFTWEHKSIVLDEIDGDTGSLSL